MSPVQKEGDLTKREERISLGMVRRGNTNREVACGNSAGARKLNSARANSTRRAQTRRRAETRNTARKSEIRRANSFYFLCTRYTIRDLQILSHFATSKSGFPGHRYFLDTQQSRWILSL